VGLPAALAATAVFGVALGVANGAATLTEHSLGWDRPATSLVQAALCSGLTLAGICWLARQLSTSAMFFGLRRRGIGRDAGLGLLIVLASAGVVLGLAALAGLITVTAVRPAALAAFLLTTVVVATGFEAFPEELAFRGFVLTSLQDRCTLLASAVGATVLFVVAPGPSNLVSGLIVWVLADGPAPRYAVAPAGEDPVVYVVWSICLLSARLVTGSIWTGVAAHLGMLVINRLVLSTTSGLEVRLSHPDVVLVLPAYVLLATLGFTLLRRHRRCSGSSAMVQQRA